MKHTNFTFKTNDNVNIFVNKWIPENGKIKAIVQIAHGMAEHSERYNDFASKLVAEGFAVYANDHRGHGKTAGSLENIGFFDKEDGWNKVVNDVFELTTIIKKEYTKTPLFLLGHSMGSFILRTFVMKHSDIINGLILSGTAGHPGLLGKVGILLTKLLIVFNGKKSPSNLLNNLSFGDFNKPFKPNRTDFDWLSRDEKQVDKYINDPYCGGIFTTGFFYDMLSGVLLVNKLESMQKISSSLPIHLFSGEKDPVGNDGKGVLEVYENFKKAGVNDVSIKLYTDARHEALNETNNKIIYSDIIRWINKYL